MATTWVDITSTAFYNDYSGYIRFANQNLNIAGLADASSLNGLRAFRIQPQTRYRVTMAMRNRFRLGCTTNLNTNQIVTNYIFDPLDLNDATDQNGTLRTLEITTRASDVYLSVGGWSSGATETIFNTLNTIVVEEERDAYTCTFTDWEGTVLKQEIVLPGASATPPANPTRVGHTFTGWSGGYDNVIADTTITATYRINSYTVTFEDHEGTVLKTEVVNYGASATPPADPTRIGYTFTGWSGDYSQITADLTVTAQYVQGVGYLVSFVDWDNTVIKTETVLSGASATPPANPIRTGYTFTGWSGNYTGVTADTTITAQYILGTSYNCIFTDWDGTVLKAESVLEGNSATPPADPNRTGYAFTGWSGDYANVTADTTITATYRIKTYLISFCDYEGTVLKMQIVVYGVAATPPADPIRTGYTFAGWLGNYTDITDDTIITASYVVQVLTASFLDWDGSELKTETVNYGTPATPPADPIRTGYTFTGWSEDYNQITTDINITAVYNINSYIVTFEDHDGTVLKTESVEYEGSVEPPADPTRIGHTFTGWSGGYTNVTADTTITAAYNIDSYTVIFEDHDGAVLKTEAVNHGSDAVPPDTPIRDGYLFDAWVGDYTNITAAVTVTASYIIDPESLTGITIIHYPDDNTCDQGEDLNLTGMEVVANYRVAGSITITDYTLSGLDNTVLGEQTVTVNYRGFTASFRAVVLRNWDWCRYGIDVMGDLDLYTGVLTISGTGDIQPWRSDMVPLSQHRSKVKTVIIEPGVTAIGNYTFYGFNQITSVTLPDGIRAIGSYAFYSCKALTSINFPNGLVSIGAYAFMYCNGLTSLDFPEGLSVIGDFAFRECKYLTTVVAREGLTVIGENAFVVCDRLTSFTFPPGLTTVKRRAFSNCPRLSSANFQEGLVTIGERAFTDCYNLRSVILPEGLISIGEAAFAGNEWLYSYNAITELVLPSTLETIAGYAFRTTRLRSITVLSSVVDIGVSAFSNCPDLTTVTLAEGLTKIPDFLFATDTSLSSIELPSTINTIGQSVFKATLISQLNIPEAVTTIHASAFKEAARLTSIYVDRECDSISGSPWNATRATITWRTAPLDYLEITNLPPKRVYNYGEELDSAGLTLVIHYTDSTTADAFNYTLSGYNPTTYGEQTITITYLSVTASFTVYVVGLVVATLPTKLDYNQGEVLDMAGSVINYYHDDGQISTRDDYTVSAIDTGITGVQTITVSYAGFSAYFNITYQTPVELASIISNTTGMTVFRNNVPNTNNTTDIIPGVDWFISSGEVVQNIAVYSVPRLALQSRTYLAVCSSGTATTFSTYRLEGVLTNGHRFLKIRLEATTRTGYYSDEAYLLIYELFMFDDGSLFLNCVQIPTDPVYLGGSSFQYRVVPSGSRVSTLRITAGSRPSFSFYPLDNTGNSYNINPLIHEYLISRLQITPPFKTSYILQEDFDPEGLVAYAISVNGERTEIATNLYDVYGFNSFEAGTQTITVSYLGFTAEFEVTISAIVTAEIGRTRPESVIATLDLITGEMNITGTGAMQDFPDGPILEQYLGAVQLVNIAEGVTSIGAGAFVFGYNIPYNLPSTLVEIGESAFECSEIGYISFPEGLETLGIAAFRDCYYLDNVHLPNSLTHIPESAFSGCSSLSDLSLGNSVVEIGADAFSYCYNLTYLSFPDTLTTLGEGVFRDSNLYELRLPNGLTNIPASLCFNCGSLSEVFLGSGLESIDPTAFVYCFSLYYLAIDARRGSIDGAPWGAEGEVYVDWLQGGVRVTWKDWDDTVLKDEIIDDYSAGNPPAAPSREGYIFTGWNPSFVYVTQDTIIHAVYVQKILRQVNFVNWNSVVLKTEYLPVGSPASPPTPPNREGYIFAGWNEDYRYITEDLTVMALYTARTDQYTVIFQDYDGTTLKTETVTYGQSASAPNLSERENYYFLAWSQSFAYVTADLTTVAQYRPIQTRLAAEVYNGWQKVGEISQVLDCIVNRKLDGECTLTLTTLATLASFVQPQHRIEINGLVFRVINIEKSINNGLYQISFTGEHLSYLLNDEDYQFEEGLQYSGSPAQWLGKLLEDTPFSVGTVEPAASELMVLKPGANRRQALMLLLAQCGGELEYDGYKLGIRNRLGSQERISLMDTLNVKDVAMSMDTREQVENYSIQLFKRVEIGVGDEISLVFNPLGINTNQRITEISYNPFNPYQIQVALGNYYPDLRSLLQELSLGYSSVTDENEELEQKLDTVMEQVEMIQQTGIGTAASAVREGSGIGEPASWAADLEARIDNLNISTEEGFDDLTNQFTSLDAITSQTNLDLDDLTTQVNDLSTLVNSGGGGSGGGLNVVSTDVLPENPDPNTLYLMRAETVVVINEIV